jgi:hypothetical protein
VTFFINKICIDAFFLKANHAINRIRRRFSFNLGQSSYRSCGNLTCSQENPIKRKNNEQKGAFVSSFSSSSCVASSIAAQLRFNEKVYMRRREEAITHIVFVAPKRASGEEKVLIECEL